MFDVWCTTKAGKEIMTATIAYDKNGNKIVKIKSTLNGMRGFSIQTNGNLKKLNRLPIGFSFGSHSHIRLWCEIIAYLCAYGTKHQQSFFAVCGE